MINKPEKHPVASADTLAARLADSDAIDAALRRGVREALLRHKKLGNPVVVVRDGKPVWLQPDEIPINDESDGNVG